MGRWSCPGDRVCRDICIKLYVLLYLVLIKIKFFLGLYSRDLRSTMYSQIRLVAQQQQTFPFEFLV